MKMLPLLETTTYLDRLPMRVSTQCLRQRNYPHIHEHIQLCYVLSGTLKHTIGGHEYIQGPDSCSFILPYAEHMTDLVDSDDTPVVVFISFWESFLTGRGYDFFPYCGEKSYFEGHGIPQLSYFSGDRKETAQSYIRSMMEEFSKEDGASHDRLAQLLAEFLRASCTKDEKKPVGRSLKSRVASITDATHYIVANYAQKINIDDIAEHSNMSRSTFTQNFKSVTGLTFLDFLMSVRLKQAVTLYTTTDMLLDEIADRCGLYNRTNLARVFQKYFELSPTQFREHRQKNNPNNLSQLSSVHAWLEEK